MITHLNSSTGAKSVAPCGPLQLLQLLFWAMQRQQLHQHSDDCGGTGKAERHVERNHRDTMDGNRNMFNNKASKQYGISCWRHMCCNIIVHTQAEEVLICMTTLELVPHRRDEQGCQSACSPSCLRTFKEGLQQCSCPAKWLASSPAE